CRTRLTGIAEGGVNVEGEITGKIDCDHVVLDEPPVPDRPLLDQLRGKLNVAAAGDCVEPADLYKAIHEGFRAGYAIE
ncbi:MAG TPA: hypothetical protein VLS90_01760, partial [Thermodesulfobacteriota bacterium]|nr:hypothetical protein [Thermodesulfobacteriota bacterium]